MEQDPVKEELRRLAPWLEPQEHDRDWRVLEVGCGDGRLSALFAPGAAAAGLWAGLDPDPACVARAAAAVPAGRFVAASGQALPFGAGAFQRVLFSMSLHHHPDPAAALAEAARVLAPGGRVVVEEPEAEGEYQQLFHIFEEESAPLAEARRVVERERPAALSLEAEEALVTLWCFRDRDELHHYLFRRHGYAEPDPAKAAAMDAWLGRRVRHRPLVLRDGVRLHVLQKS
jgi:SAM-dependent methyltransferase